MYFQRLGIITEVNNFQPLCGCAAGDFPGIFFYVFSTFLMHSHTSFINSRAEEAPGKTVRRVFWISRHVRRDRRGAAPSRGAPGPERAMGRAVSEGHHGNPTTRRRVSDGTSDGRAQRARLWAGGQPYRHIGIRIAQQFVFCPAPHFPRRTNGSAYMCRMGRPYKFHSHRYQQLSIVVRLRREKNMPRPQQCGWGIF